MTSKTIIAVSAAILIVCVTSFEVARLNNCRAKCVRATILWTEDLERDDMPVEPRNSPVVIEGGTSPQKLYELFALQKPQEGLGPSWIACVDIIFEFSCGHEQNITINNSLSNWIGLRRRGEQSVPSEFIELFAKEFNLPRD